MTEAEDRRRQITEMLKVSGKPVSATALSGKFHVSRQTIVGDVAILRAAGSRIEATARGYVLEEDGEERGGALIRRISCRHTAQEMRAELYLIVDQGCTVRDVIVDHPVYGRLTGRLMLSTRYDVDRFLEKSRRTHASPLASLTDGVHIHTLLCPDEDSYGRVIRGLQQMQVLLDAETT